MCAEARLRGAAQHDMSRDYVLLAEQRAAEVDLKNRCVL